MTAPHVVRQVPVYGRQFARPNLPVPLSPTSSGRAAVQRYLFGLREPSFTEARRSTVRWTLVTVGAMVVGQFLLVDWLRPACVVLGLLAACYLGGRAAALCVAERDQHRFEPVWLTAQSRVLRERPFEVIRFTVRAASGVDAEGAIRRVYDLNRPAEVRDLLRLQASQSDDVWAAVTFSYWAGPDGESLEEVRRPLREIDLFPTLDPAAPARVRFPEASYGIQPGGREPHAPRSKSRLTYWTMPGRVRLTMMNPDAGTRLDLAHGSQHRDTGGQAPVEDRHAPVE